LLVLLTKADKLSRSAGEQARAAALGVLGDVCPAGADASVALFSALKHTGVEDAAVALHGWVRSASAPR
jgi:GTP-binding protein